MTPGQLWEEHRSGRQQLWQAMADYGRWVLVRRAHSHLQVLESMTELWEDVLHVPVLGEGQALFRTAYGNGIRRRALGSYEELLRFAVTHPAMGVYLNNATSRGSAPNEDLARELLECHTVGRGASTEADVKGAARALTGYRVDVWNTWKVAYDPVAHGLGTVEVLGFSDANLLPDGRPVVGRMLRHLAHHPATARRIAFRLAQRFVADSPPPALVERLAQVYLDHGTQVKPVLRALVGSAEFRGAAGSKVRTPEQDVVATHRALGVRLARPTTGASGANAILWQAQNLGLRPFGWPRPDGRPDTSSDWSSTSRMLASFDMHWGMAGRWWPREDVVHRSPASWLPEDPVRFDALVDHLARTLLGRRSTDRLLQACCEATGAAPADSITSGHPLVRWEMARLLACLLDQPEHMTR